MSLIDTINADIKTAMLARDKEKLEALRAVKAALLIAQTSGETLSEDADLKLLQKLVKQRREAAEIYENNGRSDLAQTELSQVKHIEVYLPKQISLEEIKAVIAQIISDTGATSIKDMGKVMGLASKQMAGKADNKLIADIVKEKLSL